MKIKKIKTDLLIIGAGTAGCYSAIIGGENFDGHILIVDKAHIKRSGCLAAGVNALNAYITKGQTVADYVDYAKKDAEDIVREDLLYSMALKLNEVTERLESLGLTILKDEQGEYIPRGKRNIKINGENIKEVLAQGVANTENVTILNHVSILDYLVVDNQIVGAVGIDVNEEVFFTIEAKAVICATGGASGLYRPNNPGFSRHKMWYSPFNTGSGYAMGIRSGAEMTTFEMRFIALRCKDTIAPTGTIAQGVGAKQVNSLGENYEEKYGLTTSQRVYGTVKENLEGRGPCYLKTEGIDSTKDQDLLKAYLNMAPSQTLKWVEEGRMPSGENVEIEGTEPYIVGGHTGSGYWVDTQRMTTIEGLYAAGDVAGGCPQKYVTGALVEGEIAALAALAYIKKTNSIEGIENLIAKKYAEVMKHREKKKPLYSIDDLRDGMQKTMDTYGGGIKTYYGYTTKQLKIGQKRMEELIHLAEDLVAEDMGELVHLFELKDQLLVCKVLLSHLEARKETRWHCFGENLDYPKIEDNWLKYVNSVVEDGQVRIILRDLVKRGELYEHID